jgi:hypothetical protein
MVNVQFQTPNLLPSKAVDCLALDFETVDIAVVAVAFVDRVAEAVGIARKYNKTTDRVAQRISFDFRILDMCSFNHLFTIKCSWLIESLVDRDYINLVVLG